MWKPPPPPPPEEPRYASARSTAKAQPPNASDALPRSSSPAEPQYMRVMHDFISRNSKELTIRKGEIVEVSVHETKAWVPFCYRRAETSPPAAAGHVQAVVEGAKPSGGGGLRAQQRPGGAARAGGTKQVASFKRTNVNSRS